MAIRSPTFFVKKAVASSSLSTFYVFTRAYSSTEDPITGADKLSLPEGLKRELMPRHVAVIMDGNSRWAKQRGQPQVFGHEAGIKSVTDLTDLSCKWGISVLSVYAFSYENWKRSKEETDFLMMLIDRWLRSELENYIRKGIRFSMIGDLSSLPKFLQDTIAKVEESTRANSRLHLVAAISYSGRRDLLKACKNIAEKVRAKSMEPEDINESLIDQELSTNCTLYPNPDLLIRTSGELRLSNFFLWQLAYSELFFSDALWPDFGEEDFLKALRSYQHRQRRYGERVQ
ncbi:cis-prenyltransferase 4, chloroplastic-like [Impatiens glandulifera]|uniref:cis-prenyltransferase 4, chloroplastic-like n=1 Tax=Impatiens glandulifera TaxID=253017 RepID=UPI001FB15A29|nr:cis-prenyltransferase 4, chloroplastic-like [Impatiens glandulifera]